MPSASIYVRLRAEKKLVLCKRHSEYPKLLLRALSRWAGSVLKLPKNPSHATLLVLFKKPVTEEAVCANPAHSSSTLSCLDRPLRAATDANVQLGDDVGEGGEDSLHFRARRCLRPHAKLEGMVLSDGWLQKLQGRHGLKPRRVQGKATSERAADVDEGRPALRIIISKYSPRNNFNIDESAYFYCMVPSTS
uniref:AlNc14C31G2892 protein n=1 Tax=Albugo laibachii Nc14 TaxID=890382 RepID=F0W7T9_9STRA|nr:AlNc14C31G2892 [Albugo laibachii Nc14]|eukprot:CCA17191.1 AlNc14C31G2892 [Albugo laibachii Nc14]